MTTLTCKLSSVDAITDTVYRVRLSPEADFHFRAGQYLMVVMDERDKRPFSLASTPMETSFIELHSGASELNLYAMAVMECILKEREITVEGPQGEDVDLDRIPVMHCWPGDAAPLITWGLTVTRGTHKERQNLGIYRQQVLGRNKVIMRWLSHRGGALDFQEWTQQNPGKRFPGAVAHGADPSRGDAGARCAL